MKGADAEDRAAAHLRALGREVLARNYRIPGGEIDLVTREADGTLVFTEVRQRRGDRYGSAAESVTARKLALMRRAALSYLALEVGQEVGCRLEVVTIEGTAERGVLTLFQVE
jgi:putative endonuclease